MTARILVVDDEDLFRQMLLSWLKGDGYAVESAADGEQAIAMVQSIPFDLILLDIRMPVVDGIGVLKYVKEHYPHIEIIMLTGYEDVRIAVECMKLGASEFLTKPIDSDGLSARIRSILRARDAELKVDALQTEFNSMLLHDLHTPLNSLKTTLQYIINGMAGPLVEQQEQLMRYIDATAERVLTLVKDALDLTAFEAGKVHLDKKPTNLEQLMKRVIQWLDIVARAQKRSIRLEVEPGLPDISVDANKTEQVLSNLINNAIKYNREGGTVTVRVSRSSMVDELGKHERPCIQIDVSDTGVGITEQEVPLIFDKHKQLITGKASELKTTGLGLAICKTIVEAHRGKIWAESEVGKGSKFSVALPL